MQETLIQFETAKLSKEKGFFSMESYAYFKGHNTTFHLQKCGGQIYGLGDRFDAPTQSLLQKWLREVHNIHLSILSPKLKNDKWVCHFHAPYSFINPKKDHCGVDGDNYEQVLETALYEALKLIK